MATHVHSLKGTLPTRQSSVVLRSAEAYPNTRCLFSPPSSLELSMLIGSLATQSLKSFPSSATWDSKMSGIEPLALKVCALSPSHGTELFPLPHPTPIYHCGQDMIQRRFFFRNEVGHYWRAALFHCELPPHRDSFGT